MPTRLTRILYALVSWLCDISGGARALVRARMRLGILLVASVPVFGSSCLIRMCYKPMPPEPPPLEDELEQRDNDEPEDEEA